MDAWMDGWVCLARGHCMPQRCKQHKKLVADQTVSFFFFFFFACKANPKKWSMLIIGCWFGQKKSLHDTTQKKSREYRTRHSDRQRYNLQAKPNQKRNKAPQTAKAGRRATRTTTVRGKGIGSKSYMKRKIDDCAQRPNKLKLK